MLATFTIYLVFSILASVLATALAHKKHRTWVLWGIMSMFFPPIVLILIFLPKRDAPPRDENEVNDDDDMFGEKAENRW